MTLRCGIQLFLEARQAGSRCLIGGGTSKPQWQRAIFRQTSRNTDATTAIISPDFGSYRAIGRITTCLASLTYLREVPSSTMDVQGQLPRSIPSQRMALAITSK